MYNCYFILYIVRSKKTTPSLKKRKSSRKLYFMNYLDNYIYASIQICTGSPTSTTELSQPLFSELSFLITGKIKSFCT